MFYLFIISLFCLGAIFALGGVALGGWLVYRTKRDPYDPLFSGSNKGDSFNIDDDFAQDEPINPDLPKPTAAANDAFINQFVQGLSK